MSKKNKGYNIQKGTFALIVMVIALVSSIVTVVAYGVTMKGDIQYLQMEVERTNEENNQRQTIMEERLYEFDKMIIQNQEKILSMYDDIQEIKADIKGLIRE